MSQRSRSSSKNDGVSVQVIGGVFAAVSIGIPIAKKIWSDSQSYRRSLSFCTDLAQHLFSTLDEEQVTLIPHKQIGKLNRLTQHVFGVQPKAKDFRKAFTKEMKAQKNVKLSEDEEVRIQSLKPFIKDWLVELRATCRSDENYYESLWRSEVGTLFYFSASDYTELETMLQEK